mmetsp:Transcript_15504/g.25655  ORF Transcript_15504/g.25655 Transcript_15504/m.25655 type:complete len:376 (+) Transcript_15504:102-1229(+)|eukprot:CAMPEP_0184649698 /NCGR_PEP_ID=MMETSP0308-20130426/7105_1 /TAXON_ID=38269 /ORGANISM="Gloeochaete witrockiana, Strain SAG 46.84" /LENGTH=375 /DNA_ID=CAMNT_0027082617 /DNA_START=84 /DNA_END=1211 /DNA_ORIENTATION=+
MAQNGHEVEVSREDVSDYYKKLNSSKDLKTNACCTGELIPAAYKKILSQIADEVVTKFYGCGSPIPPAIKGCSVLDLGSGTGRDVFLASALVGEEGHVIGVDMTDEQLEIANKYIDYHTGKFHLSKPNVEFRKGFIEDLKSANIPDSSVDVVISNCVINLSVNKEATFREIHRVLKEGGELYFSDVYADRRVPKELQADKELFGECLSGALYIEDFRRILEKVGFEDYRITAKSPISIENPEVEKRVKGIRFVSVTVRAFKLSSLEDRWEDYGQEATYHGTMPESPSAFTLDEVHIFRTGFPTRVSGNTADILSKTRYASHFTVTARGNHLGAFRYLSLCDEEEEEGCCGGGGGCCEVEEDCCEESGEACCKGGV